MAIKLRSTNTAHTNGVKVLVYGQAGSGKTKLISTLPTPIILSAEAGLLSLQDFDIPAIEITNMAELQEAYSWITESDEAKHFESVALDSISEVAEVVLGHEMRLSKDGRKAYGEMQNIMSELIRNFRDLSNKHVYMSAKLEKSQDETGKLLYNPSMPGKSLTQGIAYYFDEVFALRVERDENGDPQRALMTDTDGVWHAKDRSGKLDAWEAPDLGQIIKKIGGAK